MSVQDSASAAGDSPASGSGSALQAAVLRSLGALAVLTAVGAAVFAPIFLHPDSRVLEAFSDATGVIRFYDIVDQAGETPFTFSHDDLNGAPEGVPSLRAVQIAAPIQPAFVWVFKDLLGFAGALNVFLLSGVLLTGIAMFLLLERTRFGFLPSLFGALLVAFNPWMIERAISGHVGFTHGWVLILLLYTLLRLRRQRTLARAAAAGAAYGLCFLMASYTGLLATAVVTGFVAVDLVFAGSRGERLWTISLLATTFCTMAIFLVPGSVAYLAEQERVTGSLTRSAAELDAGSASPLHYVLPSPRHPVVGSLSDSARPWDVYNEKTLFFGYTTMALAIAGAVALVRERRVSARPASRHAELAWLAVATTPIALILSFGPNLTVGGVDVPMPASLLAETTTFYRVYARLGFVVAIGLAILAAAMLARLAARRHGSGLVAGALVVVALELLPGRVAGVTIDRAPTHDRWLAEQPRAIVAHYPLMTDGLAAEKLAARELYYQRFTRQPLFEIYDTQRRGTREDAIRLLARYVTDPLTPGILAAEGVRYVVVHDDVYREQRERPPTLGDEFTLLRRFGPTRVYRLRTAPARLDRVLEEQAAVIAGLWRLEPLSLATTSRGFHAGERYQHFEQEWRWMTQDGGAVITNDANVPVRAVITGLGFSNRVDRTVEVRGKDGRVLAFMRVPPQVVELRLGPFVVPPGRTEVTLVTRPGPAPLGGADRRRASIFVSPLSATRLPDYSRTLRRRETGDPP